MHLKRPSSDIYIDELVLDDEISKSPVNEGDRIGVQNKVFLCQGRTSNRNCKQTPCL